MIDYDPHRWLDHLLDVKGSMVKQIFLRVLVCALWSAGVTAFHEDLRPLGFSEKPHMIIGLALGLLLVFRTNASYDRFWEARKLWGSIINETRNLGRSANVMLADAPELVRPLLHWTMAFPYATMQALRGAGGLGAAADWLPPDQAAAAARSSQVPLAVARRISEQLAEARRRGLLSDYAFLQLDQNVQLLVDYMGGCERIHKTPLPFAYVVHIRRVVIVYCFTLPFALLDAFGWWTIPVTLFLTYALFGIEEIGVQIEDPFGWDDNDLPLERFCATIEKNLRELLPPEAAAADVRAQAG